MKKEPIILSNSSEPFLNRQEAGWLLAQELKSRGYSGGVVLGIPRGGIVVARELADSINAELDIVISHKLGYPGNPEFAIGAVTESGDAFIEDMPRTEGFEKYIKEEKARQLKEIERKKALIRQILPKADLKGRLVIITDDGIATGATMRAALRSVRKENPKKLIAALPVGPPGSLMNIAELADEVICLRAPVYFDAVGRFYIEFAQVEDSEVLEILHDYGRVAK